MALELHPDIEASITVIVARSEAEAERIARGEDVTVWRTDAEEEAAAALAQAEEFFEEGAGKELKEGEAAPRSWRQTCRRRGGAAQGQEGQEERRGGVSASLPLLLVKRSACGTSP